MADARRVRSSLTWTNRLLSGVTLPVVGGSAGSAMGKVSESLTTALPLNWGPPTRLGTTGWTGRPS